MSVTLPFTIDGRYHVVAEIGHGAHAIVYRARDTQLDRDVAVKMLRPDVLEWGVGERFAQEIKITAQLEHPHIARVHDTGEWNGRPYFISALATGASLHERIAREGALPVDDAVSIARDVANALQYAHTARVVHRDVKPENVLLTSDGALLADFGIARAIGIITEQALTTSTGVAVGTLLYMSPEQICAEKNIDGRSDQYSLALVLYEMLTGVRPHESSSVEGLRTLRLSGKQHAPRDHRPAVPRYINDAVMRALSAAPADRFASCADFARALSTAPVVNTPNIPRRTIVIAVAGVAAVAIAWFGAKSWNPSDAATVVPTREIGTPITIGIATGGTAMSEVEKSIISRLRDNLALWEGVRVTDVVGANAQSPWSEINKQGASVVALASVRAVSADSSTLVVRERDASGEREVLAVRFASNGVSDKVVQQIAVRLVGGPSATRDSASGIETLPEPKRAALDAYLRAWSAFKSGQLDSAATLFRESAAASPRFAAARLWQAQVLQWSQPTATAQWAIEAERAAAEIASLSRTDSLTAIGLRALAQNDFPRACDAYRRATQTEAASFSAWYGLGQCQRLDSIVVRDARSPTGFSFRASPRSALGAYMQALDRIPSSKLGALFVGPAKLTFASTQRYRRGRVNSPDGQAVAAFPSISHDSVVFWPMPLDDVLRSDARAIPISYMDGVRLGRRSLLEFSARWADQASESFSAQLGRALALELNGTLTSEGNSSAPSAALASLAIAKQLAHSASDSIDVLVAATRVRLRLQDFSGAALAADSALAGGSSRPFVLAGRLVPLAALRGRSDDLALLQTKAARLGEGQPAPLPEWLASQYGRVISAVVIGDCDGLQTKLDSLDHGLTIHFSQNELPRMRRQWLSAAARLALPCLGNGAVRMLNPDSQIDRAIATWYRNERQAARAIFDSIALGRQGASASATAWDAEYLESWMLTQFGDSSGALRRLENSLSELNGLSEFALAEVAPAAGLRKSLELVNRLASAKGSTSRARWSSWLSALNQRSKL